jgi:hypothetical protein
MMITMKETANDRMIPPAPKLKKWGYLNPISTKIATCRYGIR